MPGAARAGDGPSAAGVMLRSTFDLVGGPLLGALFVILLGVEVGWPLRSRVQARLERLRTNGAMAMIGMATIRLMLLPILVLVATRAAETRVGILRLAPLPPLLAAGLGFVLLDYTTYVWHRLNHRWPLLWRFHSVHHTDLDLDVTTAVRFHAGELLAAVVYRSAQVAVIGVDVAVLLVYELAMDAATEFHHSNWKLPFALERALSRVVVTPRMHGIHHSIMEDETNANWSVVFSVWDRLHGTLRLDVPQRQLVIGLPAYRNADGLTFVKLLALPFGREPTWWRLPDGTRPTRARRGDANGLAA